jgi:putative ABC transport system ATP-binding protein
MVRDIPLFKLKGLEKEYQVGNQYIHALRGIDLQIERGDYMVIWGRQAVASPPCLIFSD